MMVTRAVEGELAGMGKIAQNMGPVVRQVGGIVGIAQGQGPVMS